MAAVDAVVIGSGFGGAVSACRLAQAGVGVTLLERGRRYPAGSFPRPEHADARWLWEQEQGLFDVRPTSDVFVVQSAGLGGGSLIYANVLYRPPADLFDAGWPAGYSREALDPYYELVAHMLDIRPVGDDIPGGVPPKTGWMEKVAADLGRSPWQFRPNLAVNFGPPGAPAPNRFGVEQSGCTQCGECDIGCNVHAKNTLDLNYLAVAEAAGAVVRTRCEATHVERVGDRWVVHLLDHAVGGEDRVEADAVFVCAGSLGSTELLLRSRDRFKTLPDVSDQLGRGYSANGDFLAFAFDTTGAPDDPGRGPTITSALVYDDRAGEDRSWFVLEDGGCPNVVAQLLQVLNPAERAARDAAVAFEEVALALTGGTVEVERRLAEDRDHTAVFLLMGRDRADGTISLDLDGDATRIHWRLPPNLPLYVDEAALVSDVATAMGGRYAPNPAWKLLHQPVSVHNLGGCRMGDSAAVGVVDADGQVFNYPGLYVLDGAVLPAATGANPSHTIAAVAERCIERAGRRLTGDDAWVAPDRADVVPRPVPEDAVHIPEAGTPPPATPVVGLRLSEAMRGSLRYPDGVEAATRFALTLSTPDLPRLLDETTHPAAADGTVWVDGCTGPGGATVVGGTFHLFVPAGGMYRRRMLYSLPFDGADGRRYTLRGYKEVWDHGGFDVWRSTTTLYSSLVEGSAEEGRVLATGVLRLNPAMFARQLSTVRITDADSHLASLRYLGRFGGLFAGTLFDVFVRARLDA